MLLEDRAGIGRRVEKARREAHLTQVVLAEAVGLDRTAVSKIESGRRDVSALELARIANTVRKPMEWFLTAPVGLEELRSEREEILRIAAMHGASNVRVFGSVARGEAGPDSDVDLLVDMEPGRSLLDRAGLIAELEQLLGRPVDVGTDRTLRQHLRSRALREAVAL